MDCTGRTFRKVGGTSGNQEKKGTEMKPPS